MSDATAMAAAVRDATTTAEELVSAALDRIEARDGEVNAFTVVLRDDALARARELDAADPSTLGPLAGVPVSIKDHIWMAGQPATNGSLALRDFVPDVDAVPVARLRAAGAVIVGKTNNPEFCYRGYTTNAVFGTTRNPWALDRTPGGSSGGAGASVAYGATPIALGTDGGGSIRIPAAFCGVVGHKPTFGLVPKLPGFRGWPSLSVDGPLAVSVRDAALALRVMAGAHAADPLSWPVPLDADRDVDWSRLRVAVSEDLGWAPVEPVVRSAFRAAVDRLVDDGAAVTETCPVTGYPTELWNSTALVEGFASEGPLLGRDGIDDLTREIVEAGRSVAASDYLDVQERRREFTETWESFFEKYDVLLAPSLPIPAFGTGVTGPDRIDGTPIDPFFDDWCLLALPANLTGQPACAVPTGLTPDGLPVGLQVIGPRWADSRVLAVAQRHEVLTGFDLAPAHVRVR
ncbi:MAG: aspartyl-tRNA(Asn)/glutamyl-tRNA(Gln) amidotransferase subunit [Nocardioidaceae bacterium]|jgi:Asp-tRNA(Asn)/Glu-tRNA(Gln) amidotransferase A subunit family amidase|nr:aspartyl-tRNA(Asn)/glutamyl-tRNA(Gln) amidotransferase subunit [Nocardioidaceae bacterium]